MDLGEILLETIKSDSLKQIKQLYYSDELEDKTLAKNWLTQLIGEKDADANLFILDIYRDMDDDTDIIIDDENYCKMKFKTFTTSFGKNYRYNVAITVKFKGGLIVEKELEYSRYQVGDGQPKYDMLDAVCKYLRKNGCVTYNDLFK